MLISEMFYSLQGEGGLTGVPSVFVRTSGCNLRCRWCDTPYASWQPEGNPHTIEAILEFVGQFPARHVVLTGGEPMLAPDIRPLAARLRRAGFHVTLETAGTLAPEGIEVDLVSLSPKLANSTPREGEIDPAWRHRHEATRINGEILRAWLAYPDYQLKFVVSAVEDIGEIQCLLRDLAVDIPPWRVLLMPEGRDVETLRQRDEMLVEICRKFGYRYCRRLHIDLFGNRRGT